LNLISTTDKPCWARWVVIVVQMPRQLGFIVFTLQSDARTLAGFT